MSLYLVIFALFNAFLCTTPQAVSYRLPDYVRPIHYDIDIETDMSTFTFWGSVTVIVEIMETTNTLVLHSRDLTIHNITLSPGTVKSHSVDFTTDFLTIHLNETIGFGVIAITIHYNGTLGTGNVGYYRASYFTPANQQRFLAVTHFEATNARRAFPCFDQPNLKATFTISLTRGNAFQTASNMERVNQMLLTGGRTTDVYNTTVRMSTYLIAFTVSDYISVSTVNNFITYRTLGRPELIARGDGNYSLEVAPRAINRMEALTNIRYALSTMDQVPVPNPYYKIGAMENWGMVTYRERNLMYNAISTTASEEQHIAAIISHEFAHQWFGNLVTPQWWTYIWLNEGFATYFEMRVTAELEPTWQMMEQFVTSMVQVAFADDALETSRPMTRNAESPAEIDAQYDTIVYEKAGSVIRMAANFLGDVAFRTGLTLYLTTWNFGNVNPQNLYSSWQGLAGNLINISNVMTSWETQSGYPVVTVTRFANTTILTQERFLLHKPTDDGQSVWHIPLNWFTVNTTTNAITWFNTRNAVMNLNVHLDLWVIFNIDQTGFYRVNYDEQNWRLISAHLRTGNFNAIPVINRAQLIDDSFNLARGGRLNYSIPLDLGRYVFNEREYVPIVTFTRAFSHLDRLATGQPHHQVIQIYGRDILQGYFNATGFILQIDPHLVKMTKVTVLTWLCHLGHTVCRTTSRQIFLAWITHSTNIQSDSQSFVFCNGIRDGTEANWNTALQRYSTIREDTVRTRIAQGLGCAPTETLLRRLLELVLATNSVFSDSDKLSAVTSVYTNNGGLGVNVTLQWLTQNFTLINQRMGSVSSIVNGVAGRITTNQQAVKFSNFVTENAGSFTASMNSTIDTAVTNIERNLLWINSTSTDFEIFFRAGAVHIYSHIILLLVCSGINLFYM